MRRLWPARLGVFVSALAVVLLAAEFILRLFGAALTTTAAVPPPGRIRILCLGESTTAPTAPIDHSWPAQLQGILDESLGRGAVSVINEGRGGTNTNIIMARLPELLDRYRPQIVVAMMGVNDERWYGVAPERGPLASAFYSLRVVRAARYLDHELPRAISNDSAVPGYLMEWDRLDFDGRHREAEALARSVLGRSPKDYTARMLLGSSLLAQGRPGEAQIAFATARKDSPEDWHERWALKVFLYMTDFFAKSPSESARNADTLYKGRAAGSTAYQALLSDDWWQRVLIEFELKAGRTDAAERRLKRLTGAPEISFSELAPPEVTRRNELLLRDALKRRRIRFIAMQYPQRDPAQLAAIFGPPGEVSIVDNRDDFNRALASLPREAIFTDDFAGDFGHCTARGDELIARNVARRLDLR
jgi:GDSL-like lipase/acylhydrolase family protein/tetratricopeptide repeat protein